MRQIVEFDNLLVACGLYQVLIADPILSAKDAAVFHNPTHATPERFRRFADVECRDESPFYAALSHRIAGDPAILDLAARVSIDQPVPEMLFAAVRYLLLKHEAEGHPHRLADLYPQPGKPAADTDAPILYPLFRAFCLEHIHELRQLLQTRRVQSGDIRRGACLLPAFAHIQALNGTKSLAMIELGAGTGFNLLWNRCGYTYRRQSSDVRAGDGAAAVQLFSEVRGDTRPPIPADLPQPVSQTGIDLHPVDLNNPDVVLWLRALIWPEQHDREQRLLEAVSLARAHPPQMQQGPVLDLLPQAVEALPDSAVPVIYHTFALHDFTQIMRDQLNDMLAEMARYRDFYRISMEWERQTDGAALRLMTYHRGRMQARTLGRCEPSGRWLRWGE